VSHKLPIEAFEYYAGLGPARSYQSVAAHFKVAKGTVVQRAKKENWPHRLRALEKDAREKSEKRALEAIEAVRERQLQQARFLQAQALKAMKEFSPKDAVKIAGALNVGWKHELLLLGDPTERTASIEEITKRELATLLIHDDEPASDDGERETDADG
jgi:hypothetical protein